MKIFKRNTVVYRFTSDMKEVARVTPGEVFKVDTNDCFSQQIQLEDAVVDGIDHDVLNPATGPFYIEGAMPGDLLQVKILDIEVAEQGVSLIAPGEGVLGELNKSSLVKIMKVKDGYCKLYGLSIPIRPMIGVIGVATSSKDGDYATDTPYKHGGNMDTKDITKGSTLYLPVSQEGAMLALGDVHAIMGDGEVCFTGCEIPAAVTLETNIIKSKASIWPLLETKDSTMIIASEDDIDSAVKSALQTAVEYLSEGLAITWGEAYILASLVVDIRISQLVNPKATAKAVIPKDILSTSKIIRDCITPAK